MFPLFINSNITFDEPLLYRQNTINWIYPVTFMPSPFIQFPPTDLCQNFNVDEQKPLPKTQQDDLNEIQPSEVKKEMISQENFEKQIFIKTKAINKKRCKHYKKKKDRVYYPNSQLAISQQAQQRFLRKNIQYNLLNQIFSYFWSPRKSHTKILAYYRQSLDKARVFYEFFKILKRGIKRLISMNMLTKLCNFKNTHPGFKTISKKKQFINILSIEQFTSGVRFLTYTYLNQECHLSVLTSNKLRKNIVIQHLSRARELKRYLFAGNSDKESLQASQILRCQEMDNLNISDSK